MVGKSSTLSLTIKPMCRQACRSAKTTMGKPGETRGDGWEEVLGPRPEGGRARRGLAKGCNPHSVLDQTFTTKISILKSVLPYLCSPKAVETWVGKLRTVINLRRGDHS